MVYGAPAADKDGKAGAPTGVARICRARPKDIVHKQPERGALGLEPQDVPDAGRIGNPRQDLKHPGGPFADDGQIVGVHHPGIPVEGGQGATEPDADMGVVIDRAAPPSQGRLTPLIVGEGHGVIGLHIIARGGGAHTVAHELQRIEAGVGIPARAQVERVGPVEIIDDRTRRAREGGRRGNGRIGAEVARGIPGPDPVTVTEPGGQAGVDVAGRGGRGDQDEGGAAAPLAALHLIAGHAQVVGRHRPTQGELGTAHRRGRDAARRRRRRAVGRGETVCCHKSRWSGPSNQMRLVASIGPGSIVIGYPSQGLGRSRTDGVHGSQNDGSRKGGGSAATADDQLQARRRGCKVQGYRLGIQEDTLRIF